MAKTILVDVIRSINVESKGIIRKGGQVSLSGDDYKHYNEIGAVKRAKNQPKEVKPEAPKIEGE